ncbi:hypothetical protein H0H10_11710 [Streptomyces sp. TRM S81-3]|uniref:Uncharacterized protein n=1 Tax=Streptomyces griseicoloratus TaxID=2752516 RepID=A0A926L471_9ACTN|nr:hypothetical protein [Streptomyces griseicoloratus]MBD0419823.1 hypothetical protein [Streptomyces griseicoloratus]
MSAGRSGEGVPAEGTEAPGLSLAARNLGRALDEAGAGSRRVREAVGEFVEEVTFAGADEIRAMLREVLAEDWAALPAWARGLAYRLACLQRPDDAGLLREAAADLLCFGPDRDREAEEPRRRAAEPE